MLVIALKGLHTASSFKLERLRQLYTVVSGLTILRVTCESNNTCRMVELVCTERVMMSSSLHCVSYTIYIIRRSIGNLRS